MENRKAETTLNSRLDIDCFNSGKHLKSCIILSMSFFKLRIFLQTIFWKVFLIIAVR